MTTANNKKFYTAKYDRVFKTILCDEDDLKILKALLEQILRIKIDNIKILRDELPIDNILTRVKTVDLLVKTDKEYIHLEINTNYNSYVKFRNYVFFSDIISKKTKRGKDYEEKEKYIHLDINFGEGNKGNEINEYYIQTVKGKKYVENIKIEEYNVDIKNKFWYIKEGKVRKEYKYLLMLDMNIDELNKLIDGDEIVMEYKEKIDKLNEDEEFQAFMSVEEDQAKIINTEKAIAYKDGIEEGINQGIEKGILQNKKEMIINLHELNLTLDQISKASKLSIEEVTKIINEQGN